jgi:eukaryotic-like serine/threonine-protein kinase
MTASDRTGQTIGNHRILSQIGQGGMGAVYLAEHTVLGRRAAIKVLLPELSQSAELVQRFFFEARATAQLRHPAFVEVSDSGTLPDGSAYLVMEYLSGETLGECLARRQRLPAPEALAIAREIAAGVGHAHRHGIVHRDLKPDNVFLATAPDGAGATRIKVLDFGIAKLTTSPAGSGSRTRTGMILGTPLFMAPEQCRGAGSVTLDQRVDVYALGCILYLMLAGEPPFPLEGFGEIIAAHLSTPPPPLRARLPELPAPVEALVLRMLGKRPEDRPASMDAVIAELDRLLAAPQAPAPAVSSEPTLYLGKTAKLPSASEGTMHSPSGALSTFAGAASMIEEPIEPAPGSGHRTRWIAAGAIAAAGIGVIIFAGTGGSRRKLAEPRAPIPVAAQPTPAPTRPAPEPAPAPRAPAAPATVTLTIDSVPSGAEVVDGRSGTLLGSTPFEGRFPKAEGQAVLSVQKEGFRPRKLQLTLARDQTLSVKLERHAPAGPRRAPPPPSRPQPKEEDNDRRKL